MWFKLKIVHSALFYTLSIVLCKAQCTFYSQISQQLFSPTNKSNLDQLLSWQRNWHQCKYPLDSTYSKLFYEKGICYFNLNKYKEAILSFQKAETLFAEYDTKISSLPKCHFRVATCYLFVNDYDHAREYFIKSIEINKNKASALTSIESYYYLSFIDKDQGDFETALKNIDKALLQFKTIKKSELYIECILQKAVVLRRLNRLIEAEQLLNFSLKLDLDATQKCQIYELLAGVYDRQSNYPEAILYYKKALTNADTYTKQTIYANLGFIYSVKLKEFERAIYYLNQALEQNTNKQELTSIYNNIGFVYFQKGDYLDAIKYYKIAENQVLRANFNLTDLKATVVKDKLLTLFNDEALCYLRFYKQSKEKSYLTAAITYFLWADRLITYMRHEHTGMVSKYFWRNKTRPIYERAIEASLLLQSNEKAFYFLEKSRSALLNDKLNELGARQILSSTDQKQERNFQNQLLKLNQQIEQESNKQKSVILNNKLFDLEANQKQFIKNLEKKNPAYYQLKYDDKVPAIQDMQLYLKSTFKGDSANFVHYFFGDSLNYALVVTKTKVYLKTLDISKNNLAKFQQLSAINHSTHSQYHEYTTCAREAYKQLIFPLALPKGHLIIAQDGDFLPFEAMMVDQNAYLIQDYAISYTYSGQSLIKVKTNNSFLPFNKFIGFAPGYFPKPLAPLFGSESSLDKVAHNFFMPKKLKKNDANKENFLTLVPKYEIAQVYTHAFADSSGAEPKIYFTDGPIKLSELHAERRFNTQLLVLAACKTGVGKLVHGEGVISLSRGFSMMGIPATITSLWSLEDADTYTITASFFDSLKKGHTKDKALQMAKLKYIQTSGNKSPFHWAGLVLVGDATEIGLQEPNLLIILMATTAILLLLIRFRKKSTAKINTHYGR